LERRLKGWKCIFPLKNRFVWSIYGVKLSSFNREKTTTKKKQTNTLSKVLELVVELNSGPAFAERYLTEPETSTGTSGLPHYLPASSIYGPACFYLKTEGHRNGN